MAGPELTDDVCRRAMRWRMCRDNEILASASVPIPHRV